MHLRPGPPRTSFPSGVIQAVGHSPSGVGWIVFPPMSTELTGLLVSAPLGDTLSCRLSGDESFPRALSGVSSAITNSFGLFARGLKNLLCNTPCKTQHQSERTGVWILVSIYYLWSFYTKTQKSALSFWVIR